MIYIVHGDDVVKSRSQIINQQKKIDTKNRIDLTLENISIQELTTHMTSNSLFGEQSFVVVDVTGAKVTEEYIEVFKNKKENTVVIVYSEKTLPKTNVFIKNAEILKAKIIENRNEHNENIFKFVSILFSKDRVNTYKEYEKLIKADTDLFYVFTMILYGLRSIGKGFYKAPTFENGSSYVKTKVNNQLRKFDEQDIKNIYEKMYELEKGLKLGKVLPDVAVSMAIENVLNSR